jgi:CMP-N,N'-diacetyllegionaminic acid synthase
MRGNAPAIAIIIGRAGSKGLPGKNSLRIAGRPMVEHTIDAAVVASQVRRVIVSTDGTAIANAARSCGVEVVMRPAELASDTATVDSAVRHAIEHCAGGSDEAIVVILYANVPVRPRNLIDRAVETLIETRADSVQSYCDVGKHHPQWMNKIDDAGRVAPYEMSRVYRRQDLPKLFVPDGGVIAVTRTSLFTVEAGEPHAFLGNDRRGIITQPGEVVDVDSPIDATVAEAILERSSARAVQR